MQRSGQRRDETAIEYLRRVVSVCSYETESLLDSLPSVDAVLDFVDLWSTYDTEFWEGVLGCIAEGADPAPARAYTKKHALPTEWKKDIDWVVLGRMHELKEEELVRDKEKNNA